MLQQYLPFTVLKHVGFLICFLIVVQVATVLTVYGIETLALDLNGSRIFCCNSTYRLRY